MECGVMAGTDRTADAGGAARLVFAGDMMLARKVSAALLAGKPPADFWGNVRPELLAADAVIANLECPITATAARWPHFKAFRFSADPRVVEILRAGNVRCVSLANNHVLDCTETGLFDTLRHLGEAGIAHAGAGANLAAAIRPTSFRAGGLIVGVASVTNQMRPFSARAARPGTFHVSIRPNDEAGALLDLLVMFLRGRGAEFLVLSVHWGPNLRTWPPRSYQAFARMAIDAGFDVVHGHSAHLLQALEFRKSGLILYDTGDLLDDYWVFPGVRTDRSFLFVVDATLGRPPALKLLPLSLTPGEVNFAGGPEAEAIRRGMIRRCRNFPVEFALDGEALLARPGAAAPSG
jgi:poly-gamma-glutamate capsule biosynthesis protein CapA/YwtB (metallophosphatase superfamily)